jgi:hypothetical protein
MAEPRGTDPDEHSLRTGVIQLDLFDDQRTALGERALAEDCFRAAARIH